MKVLYLTLLYFISFGLLAQQPIINSISPSVTYPNNSILINGSGFSTNPSQLQVWFDQVKGAIISSTNFSIEVSVPAQARLSNITVLNRASRLSTQSTIKFMSSFNGEGFDPAKLTTPLSIARLNAIFDITSVDIDGDNKPDLIGSYNEATANAILLLMNQSAVGNISFTNTDLAALNINAPTGHLATGDLDGDGKPDVVASRSGTTANSVFVLENTSTIGNPNFASPILLSLELTHFARQVAISDLNGDGKPEIVVTNSATNDLYIFKNESTGGTLTINPAPIKVTVTGATETLALELQDMDGDGKTDIVATRNQSQDIFVLKNTSTLSSFSFLISKITLSGQFNDLATADFNLDGKLDIVVTSVFSAQALILLNNSTNALTFLAPISLATDAQPFGIDVSDLNGDGFPDFIIANRGINTVTAYLHNANTSAVGFNKVMIPTAKNNWFVRAGDLDGDAKPDIAYTSFQGTSFSLDILRNKNCHQPRILNEVPITLCASQTFRLNAIQSPGVNFNWNDGISSIKNGIEPFADVTVAGNYTVTSNSEGGACSVTSSSVLIQQGTGTAPADPVITTNAPVCSGSTLTLSTPSVSGATYFWTGPNNFTSSLPNVSIPSSTVAIAGNYSLTIKVGECSSNTVIKRIENSAFGNFSISTSNPINTICQGQSITLMVNSEPGLIFQWMKDGVNITGQTSTNLAVTQGGSYKVKVTNTALGCSQETAPVNVSQSANIPPVISVNKLSDQNLCGAPNGELEASVVGGNAGWNFEWFSSTNYIGNTAKISGLVQGSYTVVVSNGICAVTDIATVLGITLIPAMSINVLSNQTQCDPPNGKLEALVAGGNAGYSFELFDGASSRGEIKSLLNPFGEILETAADSLTAGNYTVVVSRNGCTTSANAQIQDFAIEPDATAFVLQNVIDCTVANGGSITGQAFLAGVVQNPSEYTFNWYFYNNVAATRGSILPAINGTGPTRTGLAVGFYQLEVIRISTQCIGIPKTVEISNKQEYPKLDIGEQEVLCGAVSSITLGGTVTLGGISSEFGASNNISYQWFSIPSGFTSTESNPIVSPLVTTKYGLVVNDVFNCKSDTVYKEFLVRSGAMSPSNVTQTSFTANWAITNPQNTYLLDVSPDSDFSSFLMGYNGKTISGSTSSENISGLSSGTTYYYRIRTLDEPSCNVMSQLTIPANPITKFVDQRSDNFFIARWNSVNGAQSYELDVSRFVDNFNSFVPGYNAKVIAGANTETIIALVENLSAGTPYVFRVRAINSAGKSGNSGGEPVLTTGTFKPLSVTILNFNNGKFTGSPIFAKGLIAAPIGLVQATMQYKGITESIFKSKPVALVNDTIKATIDESMLDELGIEFTLRATDAFGQNASTTERIYRAYNSVSSPPFINENFTGNSSSIKIISVPYNPKDPQISSIFIPKLGVYDKKSWRLAHYNASKEINEEYPILSKVERGLGYWFNAKSGEVNLQAGEGDVGLYNQSNPFVMKLNEGWNQIGNPFPFPIDWDDIMADNVSADNILGDLYVYDGTIVNYNKGNKLDPYSGGFVRASSTVDLDIKVNLKGRTGGRTSKVDDFNAVDAWQLPLTIKQNSVIYDISSIGMHPEATLTLDQFDEVSLPRLEDYLELSFKHPESRYHYFTKDVVPVVTKHTWDFSIASSSAGELTELSWDYSKIKNRTSSYYMLDVSNAAWIDMSSIHTYTFVGNENNNFRIYYSGDGNVKPDLMIWGHPYPNPSADIVFTNLILPESGSDYLVELSVYDLMGRKIKSIGKSGIQCGSVQMKWEGDDSSGSRVSAGIYLMKARVNNSPLLGYYKIEMK